MSHFKNIQSWSNSKLEDMLGSVFEEGFEIEQEPEESRSESTKNYLKTLYEKHAECIEESNRRLHLKT